MKQRLNRPKLIIFFTSLIVVCLACSYVGYRILENFSFSNRAPEVIFQIYFFGFGEDKKIPPQVTQIQANEGIIFGYNGPVWIRFEADSSFIEEAIEKAYQYYGSYALIPCPDFLKAATKLGHVQRFPNRFKWWRPTEIELPICYRAQGCSFDEAKYLLVDSDSSTIYFYKTASCGLCPSGDADRAIRKEIPQCRGD